ncbi:iron-sulfur cluster assembly scaffold protein [Candidatus Marsarchaeota archaeon]|nr:iron-sulfur cluster assembly scaffold protein [Candidatus Marsarchaeota archaeon]
MPYDIYAEKIILNYEHPHNKGILKDADAHFREYNHVCGDEIDIYIKIKKKKIDNIKFVGKGCAISMASASMITDFVKGKDIKEIEKYDGSIIKNIIGMDPGPVRMKCATLGLRAIKEAIEKYKGKK